MLISPPAITVYRQQQEECNQHELEIPSQVNSCVEQSASTEKLEIQS